MAEKKETERKFLVEPLQNWGDLEEIFNNLIDVKRINQTYLKPKGTEPSGRIRKTVKGLTGDTDTEYHYNEKEFLEPGVHQETEYPISKVKYEKLLKDIHPDKVEIRKTRFVFKYQDQVFELDVFKDHLKGLTILEIELKDIKQPVHLPSFLKVIEEATTDKRFSNFHLADKKFKKEL